MVRFESLTSFHAAELSQIASRIFLDTFLPNNLAKPVHDYVNAHLSKEAFLKTLSEDQYFTEGVFFENRLVGYIQLQINSKEMYGNTPLELKRFYLLSDYHGKGIAGDMMNHVYEMAKGLGYKKMWLGVWEKNDRAVKFYKKNGFERISSHAFNMGGELQTDDIYLKQLP